MKNYKRAFTLSEVLITLIIIGVAVLLSIPVLVNKIKQKELETAFKSAVSILASAVSSMGADNPDINNTYCKLGVWQDRNDVVFIPDFARYVKYSNIYDDGNITKDLKNLGYKSSNFLTSHNIIFNVDFHRHGAIVLDNGMIVFSSGCVWGGSAKTGNITEFIVDTNGLKGPNKFGYDVFYFQISENNKLIPVDGDYKVFKTSFCSFKDGSSATTEFDNGCGCAKYALTNIFPEDNTKSYWDNLP